MSGVSFIMMVVQLIAILILYVDILFVCLQKPSPLQSPLQVLLCACLVMFLGYVIELESASLGEAMLGASVAYIGKPFVMLASWQFICAFYNRKIPGWLNCLLYILCSSFFWIVFTNKFHHLYYATTGFDSTSPFSPLIITHGPLYYLYVITAVAYFIACIVTIIQGYRQSKNRRKKQFAAYLGAMVISGILGYVVYLTSVTAGYDSTMLGVFFGVIFLSMMFFRYRIFDALSLAKDDALEDSSMGLLVLDDSDKVVYQNSAVSSLLREGMQLEQLKAVKTRYANLNVNDRVYAVSKKDLVEQGEYHGRSIEIQDITDSYNYQARLEHDVRERTNRIETIQRSVIVAFAGIVEARNLETGEHTARTMELTRSIAQEMADSGFYPEQLTESGIDMISSAASLHDIGKISIPDGILLKPGKLTKDEFDIIKMHTTAGAQVIERAMSGLESPEYVQMCQDVAKYHHERWDGNGYPEGLKGEEIPLAARIMAVADVYDAVTSKRCYKETIPRDEALQLIREESGTHFDPAVVEAFEKAIEKETKSRTLS